MDSQGQSSGRDKPSQEAILAPRSVPNSQNQNRSPRMPLPHAAESAPHSARNPFRFLREMATASSGETAMPAGLPSSVPSGSQAVGNQHRPTNLFRLPRYSTLSPAVHGMHPVEDLGPATGVNLTSPLPQYTARDYVDHLAEKQDMPPSSMAPVNALDEKSELRSSPVQEQHPPLPFSGDVDANVAELRSARPYDNLNMSEEIPHLVAIDTKEYERYKRAYCYPEKFFESGRPTIDPLTTSFEAPPPPSGWKAFIHPEGARYFYYDDPNCPVPVLTEAWLYDKEQCAHIHRYMTWIFEYMEDRNISFCRPTPSQYVSPTPRKKRRTRNGSAHFQLTPPSDPFDDSYPQHLAPTVLVLDIRLTGNTGYYFVDHPTQTIFWLEPYDYSLAVGEVHTDYSTTLIGLEMKSHYWTHNDLFPHLYELEEKDLQEVDDMVGFAIGDALTSLTGSATIFNPEQLKQLQKIIHRYDMKRWERRRKSVGERRMICRVLADIYHERFLNLHGERGARLNNTQSIHYSPYRRKKYVSAPSFTSQTQTWFKRLFQSPFKFKPQYNYDDEVEGERAIDADPPVDGSTKEMYHNSMLMNLLSLVMFGGPGVHMRRLRDMTVDRVVSKTVLAKYMERMMEEWRDVTLYGTVLLGANVSFLTIQSVDEAGVAGPQRTPSQRASYFSILASMGTIVSSFMLLGRHREVADYTFIAHRSNSRWGLESLALMYGMPFSLAIWSIISFFMSFAILWFDNTDYVVMGLVGSFSLLFAFFLFWAILAPYEKQPYEFFVSRAADRVRRAGRKSVKAVRRMTKRLSTAGAIAQKEPTSPSIGRVPNPELPPNDGGMPDMRPSMSSSVTRRISGTYKQHRRTWSEAPSTTIEGDGDPPDTKKTSLDTGQRQEGVQMDAEEAPSAGKGARFYSPV